MATEADLAGPIFYVGVKNGEPVVVETGDNHGDCKQVELFPKMEDACSRYHNVRRVMLVIDPAPVRAPESWGSVQDGE